MPADLEVGGVRVLIVEDSPTQAAALQGILESAGHEVDVAPDGETAVEMLRASDFGLVVADVVMPGMSGFELCRRIREEPETAPLPVVLTTALGDTSSILSGLASGANGYITKPFEEPAILRRISDVMLRVDSSSSSSDTVEISLSGEIFRVTASAREILDFLVPVLADLATDGNRSAPTLDEATRVPVTGELAESGELVGSVESVELPAQLRLLVVEDSRTQAEVIRSAIEAEGHLVETALDRRSGSDRFTQGDFDVVLCDVVLPDMSGYDVCRLIRKGGKSAHTAVLMLTSLDDPSNILRGLEAGADNFISKPVDMQQLLVRARAALVRRRSRGSDGAWQSGKFESQYNHVSKKQIVGYLLAAFEDISQSKMQLEDSAQAARSAQEERAFTQAALDALDSHVAILDESGKILAVNEAWRGFALANDFQEPEFGVGLNYRAICETAAAEDAAAEDAAVEDAAVGDIAGKVASGIEEVASSRRDLFYQEYSAHSPEEQRWFAVRVTRFRDSDPVRLVVAHENITDRKLSELEVHEGEKLLAEREVQYRGLFEQAAVGIALLGLNLQVFRVNQRFCEITGYDREELLDTLLDSITHPDDAGASVEDMRLLLEGELSQHEGKLRYVCADGSDVWVHVRLSAVRDVDGSPLHLMAVVEDVTEQRKLEDQLSQAQKMEALGRLAGGVAHDFNNILTVILGEGHLLLRKASEGDPAHEGLTEIVAASKRAADLTRQLLAFSRKEITQPITLNLNTSVESTIRMLDRLSGEDIELRTELADDLWNTIADPGQIDQVLANLTVNAKDAIPRGGVVKVRTRNSTVDQATALAHPGLVIGDFVVLAVEDNGTGIPDDVRAHLFEPFFTTKTGGKGTGLGLATVYGIVKKLSGYLMVDSEVGEGTTMSVFLPRSTDPLEQDAEAETVYVSERKTILLVEDEDAVRRITFGMLEEQGHEVIEATSGAQALQLLGERDGKVDLILTDVVMPGMSGRELSDHVARSYADVSVLYMSGYTADKILDERIEQRNARLVQKPFTYDTLAKAVQAALQGAEE